MSENLQARAGLHLLMVERQLRVQRLGALAPRGTLTWTGKSVEHQSVIMSCIVEHANVPSAVHGGLCRCAGEAAMAKGARLSNDGRAWLRAGSAHVAEVERQRRTTAKR